MDVDAYLDSEMERDYAERDRDPDAEVEAAACRADDARDGAFDLHEPGRKMSSEEAKEFAAYMHSGGLVSVTFTMWKARRLI